MAITVDGTARPDLDQVVIEQERDPITAAVGITVGSSFLWGGVGNPITPAYSGFDTTGTLKRLEGEWRPGMGLSIIAGGATASTGVVPAQGGSGTGMTVDIISVESGAATEVAVVDPGDGNYKRGEEIALLGGVTLRLGSGA